LRRTTQRIGEQKRTLTQPPPLPASCSPSISLTRPPRTHHPAEALAASSLATATPIRPKSRREHRRKCIGRMRQPRGPLTRCLGEMPTAFACRRRIALTIPQRESTKISAQFSTLKIELKFFGPVTKFRGVFCILYSVICLRGNGVILRTQKVIQGDDNGHVGRPCVVSLDPPCPELFCELRGLCRHSYFGPRTCSRNERPISSKWRGLNQGFQRNPSRP
jgi:hypothetical protein